MSVVCGTLDLVIVVVQAGDVSTGELGNLASRSAHTTTDIQHFHALLDADLVGEVMFVTGDSLVKALADRVSAEVEGLAPAIFVDISGEIVVSKCDHVS